ncbi:hypothetical protein ACWDU0_00530 [Streptomyces cellulosae]
MAELHLLRAAVRRRKPWCSHDRIERNRFANVADPVPFSNLKGSVPFEVARSLLWDLMYDDDLGRRYFPGLVVREAGEITAVGC